MDEMRGSDCPIEIKVVGTGCIVLGAATLCLGVITVVLTH